MATAPSEALSERPWPPRPAQPAACEACRKQKMRCTRTLEGSEEPGQPCDRCRRNNRSCHIPERRPQGRRPGAVGRYSGVEKAVRQIQNQVRKASRTSNNKHHQTEQRSPSDTDILEILLNFRSASPRSQRPIDNQIIEPASSPACTSSPTQDCATVRLHYDQNATDTSPHRTDESVSNPLGLLADASGEAQANQEQEEQLDAGLAAAVPSGVGDVPPMEPIAPSPGSGHSVDMAQGMLRRPGYVSLGLELDRGVLEGALQNLLTRPGRIGRYANYFKTANPKHSPDTGPDVDPVDLGLVSMEEAWYLFPIFFERLHPINGILDPVLHTPDFVRPRSALLFTSILAITAQFDHASGALAKRLRLHGEKLSKHVHSCGYKSVEIAQGYYISLLAAVPTNTQAEDHSWIYTTYALGMISDLGLDRPCGGVTTSDCSGTPEWTKPHQAQSQTQQLPSLLPAPQYTQQPSEERLIRNRERTWFRVLLWERAHSAASGRVTPFPENDLTRRVQDWWRHPLADPTDKYTCAFVILRRHLSTLYYQVKERFGRTNNPRHWVRDLVDSTLDPWRRTWVCARDPRAPTADQLRNLFLHYVYMHGRLWTLSFALNDPSNNAQETDATKDDCFEAAVNCCEVTIRDLRDIGEPMYCMMAPTWAMSSYAAVLALRLFPQLYGDRPGQQVELLALLAEVALQMEKAGTTPKHRFGVAALLGQHLFLVLRRRLGALKNEAAVAGVDALAVMPLPDMDHPGMGHHALMAGDQLNQQHVQQQQQQQQQSMEYYPFCFTDPFFSNGLSPRGAGAAQEAFADMMREWGGLPFDGAF